MQRAPILMALILGLIPGTALSQNVKTKVAREIFKAGMKLLTGAAAAESMRRSAHGLESYRNEKAILQSLREKGLSESNDSIYSIYFRTNGGYWADLFSYPDIFFYVDIEGQGSFLVPEIHWNYTGGPILDRVLARGVKPGTRIVVRVLDDDSASDQIWNSILRNRQDIQLGVEVRLTNWISIRPYIGGQIQLLDRNVMIDAPDLVATAEFTVPDSNDGVWVADGTLHDENGSDVGKIQFACVWSAQGELSRSEASVSNWLGSAVFWLVLGLCLLVWFLRQVFGRNASPGFK
jgi:hypothetical protein